MSNYIILDPVSGIVIQAGSGPTVPDGALQVIGPQDQSELIRMYLDGDTLLPRPVTPVPVQNGQDVTIPPLPLGSAIEVIDIEGSEIMHRHTTETEGYTDTLTFTDPGRYQITLQAPLPHLPSTLEVFIP